MSDSILVDTSAWILSFRETGNPKLKEFLRDAIEIDRVATTNFVILEILQGCKTTKEYGALKTRFDTLPLFAPDEDVWTIAYETGFSLRRKGITAPTVDILICSIAKRNGLALLHHDEHIRIIARMLGIQAMDYLKSVS